MGDAFANDRLQFPVERMVGIRAVEALVAVTAADDQIRRLQLCDFVLNGAQGKKTQACQLARIKLLPGIGKEQSQYLRPYNREQSMKQCLFDMAIFLSNALNIQALKGFKSLNVRANRLAASVDGTSLGTRPRQLECFKHSRT